MSELRRFVELEKEKRTPRAKGTKTMKNVELKLIAELMKNSRRSDRDLAKAVGVSQPTISRLVRKLEKDGVIKEYTIVPDFGKLGFEIMAITFLRRPEKVSAEEYAKIVDAGKDIAQKKGLRSILALRGLGLDSDVALVSLSEDYAQYLDILEGIKEFPQSDVESVQSFLISLRDEVQYRPLTFSYLADYLSEKAEKEEKKTKR